MKLYIKNMVCERCKMVIAMNTTDYLFTGGAMLTWWVIPVALLAGFLTPWPYNYWRLQKLGKSCH